MATTYIVPDFGAGTITAALASAVNLDDEVHIRAGTYAEGDLVVQCGLVKPFPGDEGLVIVDGSGVAFDTWRMNAAATLRGIQVIGPPTRECVQVSSDDVIIEDCDFSGTYANAIQNGGSNTLTVRRCEFSGTATGHAIDVGSGQTGTVIENVLVTGAHGKGIRPGSGTCYHTTVVGCTTDGYTLDGAVTVRNAIATGCGGIGFAFFHASANVDYSCTNGNVTPYSGSPGAPPFGTWSVPHNITTNPLYVGGADYSLQNTSPCKDTGTAVGVTDDLDGDVRPRGAGPDRGAYEFQRLDYKCYVQFPLIVKQTVSSAVGFAIGDRIRLYPEVGVHPGSSGVGGSGRLYYINGNDFYLHQMTDRGFENDIWITNGTATTFTTTGPTPVQNPATMVNPVVGTAFTGLNSDAEINVIGAADGRLPTSVAPDGSDDLGLKDDDYEPFMLPTWGTTAKVVEVAEADPALVNLEVGERLYHTGGYSFIRAIGEYYLVLVQVSGTLAAAGTLTTNRPPEANPSGVWAPVTNYSLAIVDVWEEEEYSVPNVRSGQFVWADTLLQEDYVLRVYYTLAAVNVLLGDELRGNEAPLEERGRWTAVTNSVLSVAHPGMRYVGVIPTPGYPRTQPYFNQVLSHFDPADSGNDVTIGALAAHIAWRPGGTPRTDAESGRNVRLTETWERPQITEDL
jgi:hypothetical protein